LEIVGYFSKGVGGVFFEVALKNSILVLPQKRGLRGGNYCSKKSTSFKNEKYLSGISCGHSARRHLVFKLYF
jgi:hypothetical protein